MVPADQPAAALRMLKMQMAGDVTQLAEQRKQHDAVSAALARAASWLLPQRWRRGKTMA